MSMRLDNILKKIKFAFLLLLATMPLLPYGILSVIIISYTFFVVLQYFINPIKFNKENKLFFISQIAFFLILVFSLLFSEDKMAGIKVIKVALPLLIFPILSLVSRTLNKNELNLVIKVFVFSSFLLSVYLVSTLFYTYGTTKVFNTAIVSHMMREEFFYLDIHPIYTGMYFVISILFCIKNLSNNFNIRLLIYNILVIISLCLAIAVFNSKTIILLLILCLFYLVFSSKKLKLISKMLIIVVFLVLVLFVIINVKTINARFTDLFNTFFSQDISLIKNNSTFLRWNVYSCGMEIFVDNPIFGIGTGDVQKELFDCYNSNHFFLDKRVESVHNFYLRMLLSSGVIGLLFFLYSLYVNFKISIKNNSNTYILILVLFSLVMFVEDYLLRANGVTLYALSNHLFYIHLKKNC